METATFYRLNLSPIAPETPVFYSFQFDTEKKRKIRKLPHFIPQFIFHHLRTSSILSPQLDEKDMTERKLP